MRVLVLLAVLALSACSKPYGSDVVISPQPKPEELKVWTGPIEETP